MKGMDAKEFSYFVYPLLFKTKQDSKPPTKQQSIIRWRLWQKKQKALGSIWQEKNYSAITGKIGGIKEKAMVIQGFIIKGVIKGSLQMAVRLMGYMP